MLVNKSHLPTPLLVAGADATGEPLLQTSSAFGEGFRGFLPVSKAEFNQELQAEQATIDALMQRVNQLTPVRCQPVRVKDEGECS